MGCCSEGSWGGGVTAHHCYFLQGAEVVKEDLIDDIAKESGPYQPPEKIMRRSDMATDFSMPQERTIKPNE